MSCIAVLGGGISGLSAAYYLARLASGTSRIVLIEGEDRVGGWIRSRRVAPGQYSRDNQPQLSNSKDSMLFEAGPRGLRPDGPNGAILLEMIQDLNLNDEKLLGVPKSDPSVKNRYIYYNGKINTIPSDPVSMLLRKPPVFKSVILAGALEPFRRSRFINGKPKNGIEDESMYDFMKRRFNEHTAINLMGAIAHGVYAGDVKQLSIQSTLRMLYEAEKNYGGVVVGMMRGAANTSTMRERGMAVRSRDKDPEWFGRMEEMSVLGFKDGMETLPDRLRSWLEQHPNVEIVRNDPVESIQPLDNGKESKIKTRCSEFYADHIVSTIPSFTLEKLLKSSSLPNLSYNPASDVAVVNFAFAPDVKLGYDGFGFLTPHRDTEYKVPVPGTLGVIFDSNAMRGQETDQPSAVKLTVMIGGADWEDAFGKATIDELDPGVAYDYARKAVNAFLNLHDKPTHSMVSLQKKCIPQYIVGHEGRMRELHYALKQNYGHLMSLTGASYMGVSVPDCIKNSRMLVEELLVSGALGSREKVVSGLGRTVESNSKEFKDGARISRGTVDVIIKS
ncbi:protoporphyrinogen oxidase [Parasitella parasitica]|nr:protoporphyrinogen oxidase [Parasitella parasitica]